MNDLMDLVSEFLHLVKSEIDLIKTKTGLRKDRLKLTWLNFRIAILGLTKRLSGFLAGLVVKAIPKSVGAYFVASIMAGIYKKYGGPNYYMIDLGLPADPGHEFVVTFQRVKGKTPTDIIDELQGTLESLSYSLTEERKRAGYLQRINDTHVERLNALQQELDTCELALEKSYERNQELDRELEELQQTSSNKS